jgi:hypothetical protein
VKFSSIIGEKKWKSIKKFDRICFYWRQQMINPSAITNFQLSSAKLEEHLLFWILVAGKSANTTAKNLEKLLGKMHDHLHGRTQAPFLMIRLLHTEFETQPNWLSVWMKELGIGCYNLKSKSFLEIAHAGLNLKTCTAEELERIKGIGMKTSRCFIMHTREDSQYAGLDTHVLSFLRDMGYDAPKATPASYAQYQEIETKFLFLCQVVKRSPAEFDLLIWRTYSQHPHWKGDLIELVKRKLKNFKFYELEASPYQIFVDEDELVVARTEKEARKIIKEYHGLGEQESQEINVYPIEEEFMILVINGKKIKKRCKDWCKLLKPGYLYPQLVGLKI